MSYFERVRNTTLTRLWINNPTLEEVGLARTAGAVGCTTNPAYGGGLARREAARLEAAIDACLPGGGNVERVVQEVQLRLVAQVADRFRDVYEATAGKAGLVSCQGSPLGDEYADQILEEAHAARELGPNVVPKIPGTRSGLEAAEALLRDGTTIIVTEVFSLAQLVETSERYLRVTDDLAVRPRLIISPITGIFCDHLRAVAAREGIAVDAHTTELAGVAFARRCNRVVEERHYPVLLLFGGARISEDFTDLVGAPTASTINYSTVEEIERLDPPIGDTIHAATSPAVEKALLAAFEDVRRAFVPGGLELDEFENFGPVQHFRSNFVAGWERVHELVGARRAAVLETAQ